MKSVIGSKFYMLCSGLFPFPKFLLTEVEVERRQDRVHLAWHVAAVGQGKCDTATDQGQSITPSDKVRDLGVIIDNELKMDDHVQNVFRGCFYQLR